DVCPGRAGPSGHGYQRGLAPNSPISKIARSMRTVLFLLLLPTVAAAQDASPYVPLNHWAMPYVEHLIARGRLVDPTPLTRPIREADLLRALEAVDSARVTPAEWDVVRQMKNDLRRHERGPVARLDLHSGIAAATYARREA